MTSFIRGGLASIMVVASVGPAWAASVGLPTDGEEHRWEVTGEYTRIFEREMNALDRESNDISGSNQLHAKASYAIMPWLQPYAKIGISEWEQGLRNANLSGVGRRTVDFDFDWGFSGGAGLQGRVGFETSSIYEEEWAKRWHAGYDIQYLRSTHDLGSVTHNNRAGSSVNGEITAEELHAAFHIGYTLPLGEEGRLTPYVGGRWSTLDLKTEKALTYQDSADGAVSLTRDTEPEHRFGAFFGVAYRLPRWSVALEVRMVDESALTVRGGYLF